MGKMVQVEITSAGEHFQMARVLPHTEVHSPGLVEPLPKGAVSGVCTTLTPERVVQGQASRWQQWQRAAVVVLLAVVVADVLRILYLWTSQWNCDEIDNLKEKWGKNLKQKSYNLFSKVPIYIDKIAVAYSKMMKRITKCRLFLPLRITEAVDACGWKKANKLIPWSIAYTSRKLVLRKWFWFTNFLTLMLDNKKNSE